MRERQLGDEVVGIGPIKRPGEFDHPTGGEIGNTLDGKARITDLDAEQRRILASDIAGQNALHRPHGSMAVLREHFIKRTRHAFGVGKHVG